jgi:hypothetical protein
VRLLVSQHETIDPERNFLVRQVRKVYPVTTTFEGSHFFAKVDGRRAIRPTSPSRSTRSRRSSR